MTEEGWKPCLYGETKDTSQEMTSFVIHLDKTLGFFVNPLFLWKIYDIHIYPNTSNTSNTKSSHISLMSKGTFLFICAWG